LYPVVADPNRVLITYTIAGPPDRNTAASWLGTAWADQREFTGPLLSYALSSGSNRVLPSLTTPLYGKVIEGENLHPPHDDFIHVMAFDSGGFKALPAMLHMNMWTSLLLNRPA